MPDASVAFSPDEVAAILRHMNGDHPEDSVLMCRAFGGQSATVSARMTGVDRDGMEFDATVDGSAIPVRIPWGHRLASRAEVRGEVVRIYRESCLALGVAPREAEDGH